VHILFVCTGNICRSPMAERLAAAYAARSGIQHFKTSSAGTRAVVGHPIHPTAVPVLKQLGGDASNFAARQLTTRIAAEADLILTMTKVHRDTVLGMAPRQLNQTFTLDEASQLASELNARSISDFAALRAQLALHHVLDVPDPIGETGSVFARVGAQIAELLAPILEVCRNGWCD
jgi:protein-tyrosine phosphatase